MHGALRLAVLLEVVAVVEQLQVGKYGGNVLQVYMCAPPASTHMQVCTYTGPNFFYAKRTRSRCTPATHHSDTPYIYQTYLFDSGKQIV